MSQNTTKNIGRLSDLKKCRRHGWIIPFADPNDGKKLKCGLCWHEKEQKNPHHWEECEEKIADCSICQNLIIEEVSA